MEAYENDDHVVIHGDALKALDKYVPDSSVKLIFADPPYNIKKAEWDDFESQEQYVEWSMEWLKEAHRVLGSTGSLYICGFSEILQELAERRRKLRG